MTSDQEVKDWLATLPDGFIKAHVAAAIPVAESPAIFHVGAALAALATVAPGNLYLDHAGSRLYPNVFIMNTGPTGMASKGAPIRAVSQHFSENGLTEYLVRQPGSPEALEEALAEKREGRGMVVFEEMGNLFDKVSGVNAKRLEFLLNDLWDCSRVEVGYVTRSKVVIPSPRFSMIGGVNGAILDAYVTDFMMLNGFWNRFLPFTGERCKLLPRPPGRTPGLIAAGKLLKKRENDKKASAGAGILTPEASARYDKWYYTTQDAGFLGRLSPAIQGVMARLRTYVLKIAMLLQYDVSSYGNKWYIELWALNAAIQVCSWSVQSNVEIANSICGSPAARQERAILRALTNQLQAPGNVSLKSGFHMTKYQCMQALENLQFKGQAEREGGGDGNWKLSQRYRKETE